MSAVAEFERGGLAMGDSIRVEKQAALTTVILDRPERRNAVDRYAAEALAEAFLEFERDDDAKVAVLYGEGGAFCAGADLKAVGSGSGANRTREPQTGEGWSRLAADGPMGPTRMLLSKPVIAAIAGHAVAGGLELALWCDLRVIEESAVFGVFCRRWGVPLVDGGTIRLPRVVGHGRAMDLILTGRPVGSEEALAIGLANRVVPDGSVRAEAEKLAIDIARYPQMCMRADRRSAYEQWDLPYGAAIANEWACGRDVIDSGETAEGARRFAAGHGRGGSFEDI
jgi:enoyl-CoA hydratase